MTIAKAVNARGCIRHMQDLPSANLVLSLAAEPRRTALVTLVFRTDINNLRNGPVTDYGTKLIGERDVKKIPTIFKRNPDNMKDLLNEVNPGCEWVFKGEGLARRKYDGTCCLIKDGKFYKRREIKPDREVPENFILEDHDENTGKSFGWVPVNDSDKWHLEACKNPEGHMNGTYELCGPKVQGNPEGLFRHTLIFHSHCDAYLRAPTGFHELNDWLSNENIEGLVWHHPDGRMAKIKKRDFGLKR